MNRRPLHTDQAPKAIGPYSQAIEVKGAGRMVFLSGQVALDPASGELVSGDVVAQTERVIKNLEAVLAAAGMTFANVVRTTVFLADMADFTKMNEVYSKAFIQEPPARVTVAAAGLPKGARVEIDAIAVAS
jgi:2-iminobutanoate/2-iminopropanoate deaminase